ncbi:hypothetical protein KIW84_045856 [Lathyrus oleraceus]|uniref:Kinesin motor domain-containing protein n=1 Tax=Pisum sativum TaxID=3888 RepID=A0A9D4XPV7_PEA|nr:hypothetical protein KIW84_045856 [Pisum sativum]
MYVQDSLGGNSKTMIIANVSPSICSANETLSTLKFAQRAKLIQNNGQLSFLTKNKVFPPLVSNLEPNSDSCRLSEASEEHDSMGERTTADGKLHTPNKEIKRMKAALVGALRREKMPETTIQNLNIEIDRMKCLMITTCFVFHHVHEYSEHSMSYMFWLIFLGYFSITGLARIGSRLSETEVKQLMEATQLLPSETETQVSNSDLVEGLLPVSKVYTDVAVVPKQQNNEIQHLISNLQREVEELRLKQRVVDGKRRQALSKILDIKAESKRVRVKFGGTRKEYAFDKVFHQDTTQESVFVEVEPILRSAMDGHNVCIFAYGQTGTGKTFTMDGTNEQLWIIPRAIEELFRQASMDASSSFTFSMRHLNEPIMCRLVVIY